MTAWWSPRLWGVHLLALVLTGTAVGLGVWQYDAWQVRREAAQRDLTQADPVPIDDLIGPDDPFPGSKIGRPVVVSGSWVPAGTVLVSDREDQAGDQGLWVVTPLSVGGPDAPAVPVVRGWVPDGTDLAEVPAVQGAGEVTGWLQPPESSAAEDTDPTDDVLPQLRVADLVQRVHQDLYGAYVVAREPGPGLEPATLDQLPDVGTFTALRNLLYAIEWWIFAGFAVFIWVRYVRDVTSEPARGDTAAESPADDDVASAP
ncbi:MAG TPA: SURF1 family protein [Nocardioides sp.]|nr:SURF1 family protein [Nocardioides sp.]